MILKKGRFSFWCDEKGNEIILPITNWESPFGIETYLKKLIINFKVPSNNEGLNLRNVIYQIEEDIKNNFDQDINSPLKNRGDNLLRVEVDKNRILSDDKPLITSGNLKFKIYQWKGTWGISIIFS